MFIMMPLEEPATAIAGTLAAYKVMVSMTLVQRQVQNTTVQMPRDRQLREQGVDRLAECIRNVSHQVPEGSEMCQKKQMHCCLHTFYKILKRERKRRTVLKPCFEFQESSKQLLF